MGIKVETFYIDDRGQEHDVTDMATSHILNTVAHLKRREEQLDKLYNDGVMSTEVYEAVAERTMQSVTILCNELDRRYMEDELYSE